MKSSRIITIAIDDPCCRLVMDCMEYVVAKEQVILSIG
jgi:hypothetical protein